ncbi:hypothetical protein Y032_0009g530 [Ancylostoma ceylanicum]|uniref:Uncharacterized protein n=1 Tax=Ancylostoma ceylanicum TaxID=53326 RepID=A0A016VI84_9BILA|nr:hypothetical protein Y032_0009g530 [Ancylostoma ceylanicum]
MAGEDVGDPFPGTSTYDASGLEWMRRFSYLKFEVSVEEWWRTMRWNSQLVPIQARIFDRGCLRDPRQTRIVVRGLLDPADSNDIQECTTLTDPGEIQELRSVVHGINGCCWSSCPDPMYILDLVPTC